MPRALAFALLLTVAAPTAFSQPASSWERIMSSEGKFSIEMPGKPTVEQTRVRSGPDGLYKTILLGCKTDTGSLYAYKITLAKPIPRGSEDSELDAEQDALVKAWNGRFVSRRGMRKGEVIGREYKVEGNRGPGQGPVTIMVCEYLSGRDVYIAAVVSLPNRQVPDETRRFIDSLVIGDATLSTPAAANSAGTELPGWGLALDPTKDCEFTPEKGRLRFNITGSRHQAPVAQSILNAPRVMREVEGDFVATVKVVGDFQPVGPSTNPGSVAFHGAGLLVMNDADNYIRLERAAINRGAPSPYTNFEHFKAGSRNGNHSGPLSAGTAWLRLERKGNQFLGSVSPDGQDWRELRPVQTDWPATLKIGLLATSTSAQPFVLTFEEYEVKGKVK